MRTDLDPSQMTPDERRRAVVVILAAGLRRLRDRVALASCPSPPTLEIPSETAENPLEGVPRNPLSGHVG